MAAPLSWHIARRLFPKVARHVSELEGELELAAEAREALEAERDRLLEEAGRLSAILEAMPDFVALSRMDGTLLYVNQGGRQLLGLGDQDLSKVKQAALCPGWVYERTAAEWLPRALREGQAQGEGALLTRDGRELPVAFVMTAHRDERGEPAYLSTIARDVGRLRRSERELREREELLRRATEAGRLVAWQVDLLTGHAKCTANAQAVWGLAQGPLDAFIERVHPDDRDLVRLQMRALRLGQPELSLECRVIHPSGAMRWVQLSGVAVSDGDGGAPSRFVGVSADTTHRHVSEAVLRESERARQALVGALTRELREPLYPLIHAVQLLGLPGHESRTPALREMMQRQLERLARVIDELPARHAGVQSQGAEPQGAEGRGADTASPALAHRILVVDDNEDAAGSLAMLLKALGADAQVAHDGAQALDMVPSFQPSAVLLDMGLPGMDGCEVARRIRERRTGPGPVLVALMEGRQPDQARRADEAGFDGRFDKTADLSALRSLLASLPADAASLPR